MEMDDEDQTLLNMTKTRLSQLRRKDSNLQKLALKSITKNYKFYAHNDIKEQNLEKLPNTLRNKVLEEFSHHLKSEDEQFSEEEFSLRLAMFRRLINAQTLKVDLTGCLLYFNSTQRLKDSLVEMLLNVLENAPNLEDLTLGECSNMKCHSHITEEWSSKISKLRKLKSLKISSWLLWFLDIDQLLDVCRQMPNLQVMWVSLCEFSGGRELTSQYLKSCFPSLIVHSIKCSTGNNIMLQGFKNLRLVLDGHCFRNAEKLKVYQSVSMIFCGGRSDGRITVRKFFTGSPGNFRMVWINMTGEADEIRGYKVYRRYYEDDWEDSPDRMVPVRATRAPPFNCIRFVDGGRSFSEANKMSTCWRPVRTLAIEDLSQRRSEIVRLGIPVIAKMFPNLERLIIKDASFVKEPALDPALDVSNLSSLRELQLEEPENKLRHQATPLSTIFSLAPNLERARLKGTVRNFFTVEELKEVTSMIANETILRKLQKLQIMLRAAHIVDEEGVTRFNDQIPEENIEQVIKLLKTASAFLPRLTEIKLTTMNSHGTKIRVTRRKRNRNGHFWPLDTDSIYERHSFHDFFGAFQ